MASISSLTSLVLDLPPSCIEFVPWARELFVVGTYHLERSEGEQEGDGSQQQQRSGSLVLFGLEGGEVTKLHTLPTPSAIFDLHFAPSSQVLGAATSTGTFNLYHIDATPTPNISHVHTLQLFPPTSLITYFAWHPTIPSLIGATLADGSVHLCNTSAPSAPSTSADDDANVPDPQTIPLHTHDLEAWVLAFLPSGTGLLTGGDDSVLKYRGLPSPPSSSTVTPATTTAATTSTAASGAAAAYIRTTTAHSEDTPTPQTFWADRRTHAAGVTALLPLPGNADLLLTGSYDDRIRLLGLPGGAGRVRALAEMECGGGVWRLKVIGAVGEGEEGSEGQEGEGERKEYTILASCMHAGTRVLRLRKEGGGAGADGEWVFEVLARFEEHKSMNYGSDVQALPEGEGEGKERTVVSTSFYDRLLCVWRWAPEEGREG